MATITKTPSNTWKAVIRKRGWPVTIKTFRTKRDAADWARSTEDEMVRGVYIQRAGADRLLFDGRLEATGGTLGAMLDSAEGWFTFVMGEGRMSQDIPQHLPMGDMLYAILNVVNPDSGRRRQSRLD